jgi:hypothetical protein
MCWLISQNRNLGLPLFTRALDHSNVCCHNHLDECEPLRSWLSSHNLNHPYTWFRKCEPLAGSHLCCHNHLEAWFCKCERRQPPWPPQPLIWPMWPLRLPTSYRGKVRQLVANCHIITNHNVHHQPPPFITHKWGSIDGEGSSRATREHRRDVLWQPSLQNGM